MAKKSVLPAVTMIVIVIAALVFVAGFTGLVKFPGAQQGQAASIIYTPQQVTSGEGSQAGFAGCGSLQNYQISVAARDALNPSENYAAAVIKIVSPSGQVGIVGKSDLPGGSIIGSGSTTASSSISYSAISVPCNPSYVSGEVYALSGTINNSAKGTYAIPAGSSGTLVLLQTPNATQLNGTVLANNLTNTSTKSLSPTETDATAMNAGDSRSGYLDVQAPGNVSFSQFGATDLGILWVINTVDSAAFSDKAVSIVPSTSNIVLTEIDCQTYPKTAAVLTAHRCYKSAPVSTSSGLIRLAWTLTSDGGANPGSTSDPTLTVADLQYVADTDGKIRIGTHNGAGTDVGAANLVVTWNNS